MNQLVTLEGEVENPARRVKAKNRREVMVRLVASLPTNEFGMPTLIYRADGIPNAFDDLPAHAQLTLQREASIHISYAEGFPTLPNGHLFWEQLPFEGGQEHLLFQQYLAQQDTLGYRSVPALAKAITQQKLGAPGQVGEYNIAASAPIDDVTALRAQDRFNEAYGDTLGHLQEVALYHYWGARAHCFDLVGQAAYRRIRSQRALLLEDQSFHSLQKVIKKTVARLDRLTEEEMNNLSATDAVKMLKDLMAMQRVNVGLPALAPADSHMPGAGDNSAGQNIEVHLKTIAKRQPQKGADIDSLLEDEGDTDAAQELIIKAMQHRSRKVG
jgi:hypothetical protein